MQRAVVDPKVIEFKHRVIQPLNQYRKALHKPLLETRPFAKKNADTELDYGHFGNFFR